MRSIPPLKGHFKGRRRHRRRELPAFLRDNPKLMKKWQDVRAWKRGECPAPAGAPGARSLLKAQRNGRLYLPDVPALHAATFKCRVAKLLGQVVMLACCKLHEGGAFIATRAELAEICGCSPRTVFNAMRELVRAGWVVSFASFHQGGEGRDGRTYRYREGPRRYVPGPVMLAAWYANLAVVTLPKGRRTDRARQLEAMRPQVAREREAALLERARQREAQAAAWRACAGTGSGQSNEGGNGCHPHRKEPVPEREVVLVTGGGVGEGSALPKESGYAGRTTEGREGGQQDRGQRGGRRQAPDRERSELDEQLAECCTLAEQDAVWARFLAGVPVVGAAGGAA